MVCLLESCLSNVSCIHVQMLDTVSDQEFPWAAAAVLHIMAGLPAAPGNWHGSFSRGAEAVVKSCIGRPESAVSAVRNVLHAAVQQHPHVAGERTSDEKLSSCKSEILLAHLSQVFDSNNNEGQHSMFPCHVRCCSSNVQTDGVLVMTYTGGAM